MLSYYHQGEKVSSEKVSLINSRFLSSLIEADVKVVNIKYNESSLKLQSQLSVCFTDYSSTVKGEKYYHSERSVMHPDSTDKLSIIKIRIDKSGALILLEARPVPKKTKNKVTRKAIVDP